MKRQKRVTKLLPKSADAIAAMLRKGYYKAKDLKQDKAWSIANNLARNLDMMNAGDVTEFFTIEEVKKSARLWKQVADILVKR